MSRHFELMDQRGHDSMAVYPSTGGVPWAARSLPSHYSQRATDVSQGMFVAGLWRIIQHRWRTIVAFTLLVVAIVVTASLLMKAQYEAVGKVVFHRENDSGVLGFKGMDTSLVEDPEDRAAIDTQIGILETDALAMQVINDLHLQKTPKLTGRVEQPGNEDRLVKSIHKGLKISKVKGTRLIEIRFRSTDPRLAADVVNQLSNSYVDQYYKTQFQASTQISEFLASQLRELQAKVEESQRKLIDYQKENGIFGLDDKQNIVTAKLDDLNRDLTAAEVDRVQKEVNYRLARSGQPELVAKLEPDNLVTKLRAQQADLENQMAQASVQLGPAHPKIIELSKQIAQVRQSVDAEVRRIGEQITYAYKSAMERERMQRAALEAQKQAADKLNANAIQSDILKHEFETNRKLYEDLLQKQKEVSISSSLKSSNIWIVDPARPPRLPAEPNILRNLAVSLLFGIFGGVLLAFGLTKVNEKIITLEQAEIASSLPSLGVVPLLGAKSKNGASAELNDVNGSVRPELVSSLRPMSLAAESYKAIVTSILLSHRAHPAVILVTSSLPGEGKTTVSTNLAIALARLRRRVLLVDTDLRRPSVHRAMRLSPNTGLGALLRKPAALDEVVISCPDVPNLFVLPAGPVNLSEDTELLVSNFKDLVDRWRIQFDHIIIDTPPVLAMTDAVRMSVEADSVILVIRAGQVAKKEFLRAQDLLLRVNARVTGFVLNGEDPHSSQFQNYYGYYGQDRSKCLGEGA
ncbi:MAG TPA: polysaccharide biosynthesis tyrosine autokinase [Pyrinomonadaceae bacterium]|nr:polysaccharide biosynthesis tyrosine autokinase [Pyrinomonadaceae bacterium]